MQAVKEPSMAKGEAAPSTEETKARVNAIAENLQAMGVSGPRARRMAEKQVAEEQAKGVQDVAGTEPPPSGESVSVAGEPGTESAAGPETPARDGVVPAATDAGLPATGEVSEPAALTETKAEEGTTDGTETVEAKQAETQEQEAPAAVGFRPVNEKEKKVFWLRNKEMFGLPDGSKVAFDDDGDGFVFSATGTSDEGVIRYTDNRRGTIKTPADFPAYVPESLRQPLIDYHNALSRHIKEKAAKEPVDAARAKLEQAAAALNPKVETKTEAPPTTPPKAAKPGKEVHTTPQNAEGKWSHAINGEVVKTYDTKTQAIAAMLLNKAQKTGNEELIAQRQKIFDGAMNPQQRGRPPKIIPFEGTEKADAQAKAEADAQDKAYADIKAKLEAADKTAEGGSDLLKYLETRRKLTDKLDEAHDEISKHTDDLIELGSVRAGYVLDEDGKPLALDENGNYDSDKRRDAEKSIEAKRVESIKAFDALIKQIDDLDAARAKANADAKAAEKKPTAEEKFEARAKANVEANNLRISEKAKADAEAKAKADARAEREKDEKQEQALREKAEAEIDAGPIGEALRRIEDGDRVETKAQLRPFMFKLEKNGVLDDISDIQEALSDREQTADDVLDMMRDQLETARDDAIDERVDELTEEAEQEADQAAETKAKAEADAKAKAEAAAKAKPKPNLTAEEKERLAELDDLHTNATNNPNTEGGRAAKKTLERITKDFDEPKVVRERAKAMLSGEYSTLAIQAAQGKKDLAFSGFTTSSQTLSHIIKTGTEFQKRLARRLRSTVRNVKMVVVEKGQELPASVAAVKAKWDRCLALYNTEEKVVYTKGESYGRTNGLNAVVQLHELFHGATSQKIRTALAYMKMGRHLDSQMVKAVEGLQKIMDLARAELNKQIANGTADPDVHSLAVYGEAFTNLHEFVSYGNTDAKLQEFLKGVKGFEKDEGLFSPFIDGLRRLIGVAKEDANALSDLVQHTDQLISSRTPGGWGFPEIGTLASAAIPPSPGGKTQEEMDADDNAAWGKVDASQRGQGRAAALKSFMALRDPRVIWARLEGIWDKLDNPARKAIALTFDRNGIASTIGKHIPALHEIADRLQKMDGMAASIRAGAAKQAGMIVNFARKDRKAMEVLDRLIPASTLARYDPANPPASGVRAVKTDEAYASLKDAGQRVYRELRDYFADMHNTARDIMEASVDALDLPADAKQKLMASVRLAFEEGRIDPYFPLMRYGDYIFRIKERGADDYESFRFETKEDRNLAAEAYAKEQGAALEDLDVELAEDDNGKDLRTEVESRSKLLKEMYQAIDSMDTADTNAKAKLKDNMYQVYLDLMPEASVRKQFIHREEVVGFSTDTLRMINTQGIKIASALSKLQYGNELRNLSEQARRQLKGKEQYKAFVGAMDAIIDEALNPKPLGPIAGFFNPAAQAWTKYTFFHNLTSLSSALLQPADIMLTGAPVLIGNHGPKAMVELTKMAQVTKQFGVWETLPDGTKRFRAPSIAYAKGLPDIELKAIADMVGEYGLSTDTLANEIFDAATKPVNKADPKAVELAKDAANMLVFGGLMHHTERLSREVLGAVSFRLHYAEMEKASPGDPANYANAVKAAVAEVDEALGDYSPGNRPQIMRGFLGKALSTYKFFPLTRIRLLGGNFFRMIPGLNKEGKIAAATKFFGILGTHSILTGVVGLPMYGIIQALWGQWQRDEDAPQTMKDLDHDTWWRTEYLRKELGDGEFTKLAKEIAKGGIANYATGMAISERLGLDNMVFRTPDPGKNLKESAANYAEAIFGAQLTPIKAVQDAMEYYSQGEYQKAFESVAPKSMGTLSATERIYSEGIETKQGIPILNKGEVTKKELVGQALGFQSARVVEAQRIAHATDVIERGISSEKQAIVGKASVMFLKAINPNRSPEQRERFLNMYLETFQEIPKFNVKYPEHGIDGKEIDAKINAELEKIAASKVFGGVKINDNNIRLFIQAALASREALNNPK